MSLTLFSKYLCNGYDVFRLQLENSITYFQFLLWCYILIGNFYNILGIYFGQSGDRLLA